MGVQTPVMFPASPMFSHAPHEFRAAMRWHEAKFSFLSTLIMSLDIMLSSHVTIATSVHTSDSETTVQRNGSLLSTYKVKGHSHSTRFCI